MMYPVPARPSYATAYAGALLFAMCSILTLIVALLSWDGTTRNGNVLVAVPGMAFTEELTGNVDFAITFSMITMGVVALLAVLLALRLAFARVLLALIGGIMVTYFIYWLIKMLIDGGGDYAAPVVMSLLLWLVAVVMVLLPLTSQAMRRTGAASPGYYPQY